jgi:ATP-dependent 26S proteasome regulatory subunit
MPGQIDMNPPETTAAKSLLKSAQKPQPSPADRLKVFINSSTPIVVMETVEEVRALTLIRAACSDLNLPVFEWTVSDGLVRSGGTTVVPVLRGQGALTTGVRTDGSDVSGTGSSPRTAMYNTTDPVQALANLETMSIEAVFVLKDFHRHLDNPVIIRRLRDVGQKFSANRRTLVLTAPAIEMPLELAGLVEFLDLPLPDRDRLRAIIGETYTRLSETHTLKLQLDADGVNAMAGNLLGLTEESAERAISQALVGRLALSPECITDVLDAKKALLKRSEMLEFVDATDTMSSVGGLDAMKRWLAQRHGAWDEGAIKFGLDPPKGVIILGVQGCGKSLCARAVAGEWNLPLVKFDTAAVYDKFIGETEKRIQKVFRVAEGLAPCVLWIDELEKVFAGSGPDSASADAGVSSRLLAAFLSWMQDRKPAVFVAATCNNVTVLPPELIRKGRFDELFFVDLPSEAERKQIFSIQLAKRGRDSAGYDLDKIAAAAEGFSGAEIESAVQAALYTAFAAKRELSNEDLLGALSSTVPLSITRAEEIGDLRAWAKNRAVWASSTQASR